MAKALIKKGNIEVVEQQLLRDIRDLIEQTKNNIARTVNQEMTILYWHIGKRIQQDILKYTRAEYGQKILETLGKSLILEYGRGFSQPNLFKMVVLYEKFKDQKIFSTLSRKLTWSHFVELLAIKDPLKTTFYAQMCQLDTWSVRTLRDKIGKKLYERTALAKKPQEMISNSLAAIKKEEQLSPDVLLQDPYIMDFLNLPAYYNEQDLETAILNEIQNFLLEMGAGFCFIARQKRLSLGKRDYYIELLLYNRFLRRIVAVELKTTHFKPEHKGQMEFYLKWLDKHEKHGDDLSPLGIILCADQDQEVVEILDLGSTDIHVAELWATLPPKDILTKKMRKIIEKTKQTMRKEDKKHWDLDEN